MTEQTGVGATEQRVLAVLGQEPVTTAEVAARLDASLSTVHAAVVQLVEAGMAQVADGQAWLTPAGREVADLRTGPADPSRVDAGPGDPLGEAVDAALSVGSAWMARAERDAARRDAAAGTLLASDEDRDQVVNRLADAFSQGRLSATELDERTGRALAARTHGELDDVLTGLGGLRVSRRHSPARAVVFWVATVLLSPFLLFGTLFVLFGSDLGDHVFGVFFLALTAPPLLGLWRWSRR